MERNDVFGIEPGGLKDGYEIRILICYLLSRIDRPISKSQINEIVQAKGLANYFQLNQELFHLVESGHLAVVDCLNGDDFYKITEKGIKTAETFEKVLPLSVREKTLAYAGKLLKRIKMQSENLVNITEVSDGFILNVRVLDIGSDLLSLQLFVPDLKMANRFKQRFLDNPSLIYQGIISLFSAEDEV